MRNLFAILVCLCVHQFSFAQSSFFLRGQVGAGTTNMIAISENISGKMPACDCGYELNSHKLTTSLEANTELGYQHGRVRFITGLQFINTGNLQNAWSVVFPSGITHRSLLTDVNTTYTHILIPLSIAYKISLVNGLSLYPELGTKLLFVAENDMSFRKDDIKGMFFTAKLNFEKPVSKQLSIVITPTYYSVISPVYYNPKADYNRLYSFNHAFLLQAGVLWQLPHFTKKKTATNSVK